LPKAAKQAAIAALFAAGGLALSYFIGPKRPNPQKYDAYECGMAPIGTTWERFPVRFYLVAMLFILFDIEIVFLYPWVVAFGGMRGAQMFLFFELLVFIGILAVGYIYIWRKGALDWE
jgi:NADH-quinone oxidoreductase subunit A